MDKRNKGILELISAEFLVSVIYILGRFGKEMGNHILAFFRVSLAFVFLGIFFMFSKKYKLVPLKYEIPKIIFFGAMHGIIILAAYISINFLTIASSVLLQATISVWVMIFSWIIFKEKPKAKSIFLLIIAFIGVSLIFSPEDFFIRESLIGSLAGLFVGLFGGLIYVQSRTFKKYDKISLTFWQNLIATPFLIPLFFFFSTSFNFVYWEILILLGLGLFGAISFVLLFRGFSDVRGDESALLTLLYVAFSIILAFVFFSEIPTWKEIIGGILILTSSYLISRS